MKLLYLALGITCLVLKKDHLPWIHVDSILLPRGVLPEYIRMSNLSPDLVKVNYTLKPKLQEFTDRWLRNHRPDFSGVVLLDAETGSILVNSSYTIDSNFTDFNYLARYTSASVFKVITAAAAINEQLIKPKSTISQIGRTSGLSRWQLEERSKRWRQMRHYSLEDSLALSINAVFGKIGVNLLGDKKLNQYGTKAGFNRDIPFQQDIEMSTIKSTSSSIETARLASGYGQFAKLSPLHAALLAASFVNSGKLPKPNLISSLIWDGKRYFPKTSSFSSFISPRTSDLMAQMMKKTLLNGTARRNFRGFPWNSVSKVGGKTGYLYGFEPEGYHDWFIGFMETKDFSGKERKLAIAVLNISRKSWKYKSSKLANLLFQEYLRQEKKHI